MTTIEIDFDEARVMEAAEHIRKKLTEFIEMDSGMSDGAAGARSSKTAPRTTAV